MLLQCHYGRCKAVCKFYSEIISNTFYVNQILSLLNILQIATISRLPTLIKKIENVKSPQS